MVEPSSLGCLETREDSSGISSAGIRMQSWFSFNRRVRRSSYEKNRWLSEDEQRETQNEAERDRVVGEGGSLQPQPQPGPAAASAGDPEAPGKAQAAPLVPDPLAPKDIAPEPALPASVPQEEMVTLIQELQAAHEFQASHFQERRKDLRSCHDCLKSLKTLKEHLQAAKTRLWHVETTLGIQVPPQELDLEDDQEGPRAQESPCDQDFTPAPPLPEGAS